MTPERKDAADEPTVEHDSAADPLLEAELTAALGEFAAREQPPHFDPRAIARASGATRRSRFTLAAAVVAAAAATAAVAVLAAGGGHGDRPLPPATGTPTRTAAPSAPLDADAVVRGLFPAATKYQNPGTRGKVHLAQVRALFTSAAAFTEVWGDGGLGATCGARADGVLAADPSSVLFYRGTTLLDRHASLTLDPVTGRISGITCGPRRGDPGDPAVAGRYGHHGAAGKGVADCGRPAPATWLADTPTSGTVVHGWSVTLDGAPPFMLGVDDTTGRVSVTCR
ncbi:hypothetical protein [Streptomyces sp. NPDC020917]|uniref:hypothetical protein n=1 Tax=Streptomyces sp. NPDC020917 TaxID=3365102 RepID=UPI00378A714B